MQNLSQEAFVSFFLCRPESEEQNQIVSFLDSETAKIDALIAEQQRLIELLQEKRQAVISHAVTKGLNPNAPMKDSGVEWLGEVPEHWEVGPIKRFLGSMNYKRVPLSAEERSSRQGNFPYYGASGIIDTVDDFLFDESLVLVSEDGANLLMRSTPIAFEAHGEYWVNNHAHILRPNDGLTLFWSERIESLQIAPFVTGSAQPKLTAEALLNLTVSCPLEEQEKKAIEARIKAARLELEPLIEAAEDTVRLLGERRSALISAAVTGQIDVQGLVQEEAGQQ
jgi:type I restriction enzyme S subunit